MSYSNQPPMGPNGGYPPQGQPMGGAPSFTLASWGQRVGAWAVDAAITFVGIIVIVIIAAIIGAVVHVLGVLIGVLGYIAVIAVSLYNYIWRQGTTGATWGKSVIGIKLVNESNAQVVGPANSFIRGLCHTVDSIIFDIGYLFPLWDPKRQTIADKIMHTVVIEEKVPLTLQ